MTDPDAIALARIVFSVFQKQYDESTSPTVTWWLTFDNADERDIGLTKTQINLALKVLLQKHLISMHGIGSYRLDAAGVEACIHPEVVEEYLGPRRAAQPVQHITINADNMQNTQIGHNNTMTVSYATALTALREQVEASELPAETKTGWIATIDDMLRHPLMPGIVVLTAAAISAAVTATGH